MARNVGALRRAARIVSLALAASAPPALAASWGSLRGAVTDTTGTPLAGVTVTAGSETSGVAERGAVSDAQGRFAIAALPAAADYALKASLEGYATVVLPDVEVKSDQATTVMVRLPLAAHVQERVRVRAQGPAVALDEQGTATRFTSEYLESLPILGRNYQDVLSLSPGVTDVTGDGNPNIHGARDTELGTLVDGINTTDPLTGKIGKQLNIESIQEIEVKTSGASAEFGRAQGGFANVLTKSGGNKFEGTVKFYWRGSALDGDGAGQDDPKLHGGVGDIGLRQLTFNDYTPFVSLSGPFLKDRAWYFVSVEGIQKQDPVNAVSQAFVATTRELRTFAKGTWQATPNTRLSFVFNSDPVEQLNQGLNSLTREETGYTVKSGGPMMTLRATSVLSPSVVLESAASYLESRPQLLPNLGLDTNGDGSVFVDRNHDGFFEASERDPGEDYDGDGKFDVWEDDIFRDGIITALNAALCLDRFGRVTVSPPGTCAGPVFAGTTIDEDGDRAGNLVDPIYYHPDGDGDRRLTPPGGCEGALREDIDCDGHLDAVNEDKNHNGILDPGEDLDRDGRLDLGIEDRNHNGILDDTPKPTSLYPYGRLKPIPADRDYTIDLRTGLSSGPYFEERRDQRSRGTLRQDLAVFVPAFHGSHDLKVGYVLEKERFQRSTSEHDVVAQNDPGYHTGILIDVLTHPEIHYDCDPYATVCQDPGLGRLTAILPLHDTTRQGADGVALGTYVQDTWKPIPNLSLGLGLRLDREAISSAGETYFDPAQEAARASRVLTLTGVEAGKDDLVAGNDDGIENLGVRADPFIGNSADPAAAAAPFVDPMQHAALVAYMHHSSELTFRSASLGNLFPGLFQGGAVDPGVISALGILVQRPQWFTIAHDNLAPRLSVAWDPSGTSRTKFFATWGRYYDRLFLNAVSGEQGLQTVQRYYVLDRAGVQATRSPFAPFPVVGSTPDHYFGTLLSSSPPTVTQVARDLKTPYSDETTVGFEREIAPETALSVRYVRRLYHDEIQDVDVNHETRIDRTTGEISDRFGLLTEVSIPGSIPGSTGSSFVRSPDGRPDLFVRDPFFNQVLRVGNFNHAFYHGVEVELRRRLSRRWQLEASYTYSRAMGQAEDFQSRLGNDPSTLESEFGYLDYDQRHVVKLNAAIYLPHDWQVGAAAQWASGLPYSIVSRFFAHDSADYEQFRTRYGFSTAGADGLVFVPLQRNSERNDATLDVDLSARRHFVVGRTTWTASFEVFNLLNRDDLWIHSLDPSRTSGFDSTSLTILNSPTELDATRRFGRRYQVGFQIQF